MAMATATARRRSSTSATPATTHGSDSVEPAHERCDGRRVVEGDQRREAVLLLPPSLRRHQRWSFGRSSTAITTAVAPAARRFIVARESMPFVNGCSVVKQRYARRRIAESGRTNAALALQTMSFE